VLLSSTAAPFVTEVETRDLGTHRLQGLPDPESIHQVLADGLPRDFPPLRGTVSQLGDARRVVLADDSVLLREGVARLLEEAGFDVVAQSGTAEDLLRHVAMHKPDVAVIDIVNRGGMTTFIFNLDRTPAASVLSPEFYGDALLMKRGITIVALAWQWDVPPRGTALHFLPPRVAPSGRSITGLVRSDITVDSARQWIPLGHSLAPTLAYPVADENDRANVLTVRSEPTAPRTVIRAVDEVGNPTILATFTVIAALHTVDASTLANPGADLDQDVLVCGDRRADKARVAGIVEQVPGLRAVNAGALETARIVEQVTPLLISINVRYKTHAGIRITGLPDRDPWK